MHLRVKQCRNKRQNRFVCGIRPLVMRDVEIRNIVVPCKTKTFTKEHWNSMYNHQTKSNDLIEY